MKNLTERRRSYTKRIPNRGVVGNSSCAPVQDYSDDRNNDEGQEKAKHTQAPVQFRDTALNFVLILPVANHGHAGARPRTRRITNALIECERRITEPHNYGTHTFSFGHLDLRPTQLAQAPPNGVAPTVSVPECASLAFVISSSRDTGGQASRSYEESSRVFISSMNSRILSARCRTSRSDCSAR